MIISVCRATSWPRSGSLHYGAQIIAIGVVAIGLLFVVGRRGTRYRSHPCREQETQLEPGQVVEHALPRWLYEARGACPTGPHDLTPWTEGISDDLHAPDAP